MIKTTLKIALFFALTTTFVACKNSTKEQTEENPTSATNTETAATSNAPAENAPETISYTVTPDSAILGKTKEALVKIKEATSVLLQDAEGKSIGAELNVKLLISNKSSLDLKKYFSLASSDARLELDNGNSITVEKSNGSSSPEPEASTEAEWIFNLPSGTTPKKLNFFLDGTRVSVSFIKK